MLNRKKGAEESNVIIFIILALIVAGLVIYFSWGFFSKGGDILKNDQTVTLSIESCKAEISIQPEAYCDSAKFVKIQGGGEMIVNCEFLNTKVQIGSLNESIVGLSDNQKNCTTFNANQCKLIQTSGVLKSDLEKTRINGVKCVWNQSLAQ